MQTHAGAKRACSSVAVLQGLAVVTHHKNSRILRRREKGALDICVNVLRAAYELGRNDFHESSIHALSLIVQARLDGFGRSLHQ